MNDKGHIASAFDRDLEGIQALIMKMGGLVEEQITDAARSLEERDEELAETVRRRDERVDSLEDQVNVEAARVLALRSPAARDLRGVLSVLRISANLERMGDYAKNMAKRTGVLVQMQPMGASASTLRASGVSRSSRPVELLALATAETSAGRFSPSISGTT